MVASSVASKVEVEVDDLAIRDGHIILNIQKLWGSLDIRHRGSTLGGGMTWVPDGQLPVKFPVGDCKAVSPEQLKEVFKDLIDTLMPSVSVFVRCVDTKDDPQDDF